MHLNLLIIGINLFAINPATAVNIDNNTLETNFYKNSFQYQPLKSISNQHKNAINKVKKTKENWKLERHPHSILSLDIPV